MADDKCTGGSENNVRWHGADTDFSEAQLQPMAPKLKPIDQT